MTSLHKSVHTQSKFLEPVEHTDRLIQALKSRGDIYVMIGDFRKAMSDYKLIRRFKNFVFLGEMGISEVYEKMGRYMLSFEHIRKASDYCFDELMSVQILNHMIFVLIRLGRLKEAQNKGSIVQRLIRASNMKKEQSYSSMAYCYYNFGVFYLQTGRLSKSLDFTLKGIRIAMSIRDYRRLAHLYNLISLIYKRMNKRKLSLYYVQKSLKYFIQIGDVSQIAGCYNNLASLIEQPRESIFYYEKALSMFKQIGYNMGIFEIAHNLANKYLALGLCRKAFSEYKNAYDLSKEMHYKLGIANSLCGLGTTAKYLGDYQNALKYAVRAIEVSSGIDNREGLLENTFLIAGIKLEMNDKDAYDWLNKTQRLSEKMNDFETLVEILYEKIEYLIFKSNYSALGEIKVELARINHLKFRLRSRVFYKICHLRILGVNKRLISQGILQSLEEELDNMLKEIQYQDLIYYICKALFDYHLQNDVFKARNIYELLKRNIDGDEMADFFPTVLFLGAKLRHRLGQPALYQIREAMSRAQKMGKKRLIVEMKRWLISENITY